MDTQGSGLASGGVGELDILNRRGRVFLRVRALQYFQNRSHETSPTSTPESSKLTKQ